MNATNVEKSAHPLWRLSTPFLLQKQTHRAVAAALGDLALGAAVGAVGLRLTRRPAESTQTAA